MEKGVYDFKKADFVCTCVIMGVSVLTIVYDFIDRSFISGLKLRKWTPLTAQLAQR